MKNTWKAIIAVILVMASLTSMASLVSAGWIESILEEVHTYDVSSSSTQHKCEYELTTITYMCFNCRSENTFWVWKCKTCGTDPNNTQYKCANCKHKLGNFYA